MLETLLHHPLVRSVLLAGSLATSTSVYAEVRCGQASGAKQIGDFCQHPSGAVYDKEGKEVTVNLISLAGERRCTIQESLTETIRLGTTGYCVNAAGRVYIEQNGKILDNMPVYQQLIETDDYKFAHLLAQLRAREQEGRGERQEPVNVSAADAAPAAASPEPASVLPPYLRPGRITYSSAHPPATEQPGEGSRPLYLPPSGQPYTPSTPVPESKKTTDENKSNDVWGYLLTGLGVVGVLLSFTGKTTCTGPSVEHVEDCPAPFESGDPLRTERFLFLGGSIVVGGWGIHLLTD